MRATAPRLKSCCASKRPPRYRLPKRRRNGSPQRKRSSSANTDARRRGKKSHTTRCAILSTDCHNFATPRDEIQLIRIVNKSETCANRDMFGDKRWSKRAERETSQRSRLIISRRGLGRLDIT